MLKRGGRLFHYIGDLESKSGHNVMKGVVRRLQEAGFERIVRRPEAFGLLAFKGSAWQLDDDQAVQAGVIPV